MWSKCKSNPHSCAILLLLCLFLCGMGVHSDVPVNPRNLPENRLPKYPANPKKPPYPKIIQGGTYKGRACSKLYRSTCHATANTP